MWCRAEHIIHESEYVVRHIHCELPAHKGAHAAVVDGQTVIWGDS